MAAREMRVDDELSRDERRLLRQSNRHLLRMEQGEARRMVVDVLRTLAQIDSSRRAFYPAPATCSGISHALRPAVSSPHPDVVARLALTTRNLNQHH